MQASTGHRYPPLRLRHQDVFLKRLQLPASDDAQALPQKGPVSDELFHGLGVPLSDLHDFGDSVTLQFGLQCPRPLVLKKTAQTPVLPNPVRVTASAQAHRRHHKQKAWPTTFSGASPLMTWCTGPLCYLLCCIRRGKFTDVARLLFRQQTPAIFNPATSERVLKRRAAALSPTSNPGWKPGTCTSRSGSPRSLLWLLSLPSIRPS